MTLNSWRKINHFSLARCAALFGVANGKVVWNWENGQVPRRHQMSRIYLATGGEVQPNDFYDLPELPRAEQVAA